MIRISPWSQKGRNDSPTCGTIQKDTPAASASAALLHGNEWSDSGSIWKTAPLVILLSWIAIAVVTVVLGGVLF